MSAIGQPISLPISIASSAVSTGSVVPGTMGTPAACIAARAAVFVPHQLDGSRGRTDPREPCLLDGAREAGVLREEAVAGMDRLGAGAFRSLEKPLDDEVALCRGWRPDEVRLVGHADVERVAVGLRVHGDGADAQLPERAEDPHGDLAPICHEHARERGHALILSERCRLRTS